MSNPSTDLLSLLARISATSRIFQYLLTAGADTRQPVQGFAFYKAEDDPTLYLLSERDAQAHPELQLAPPLRELDFPPSFEVQKSATLPYFEEMARFVQVARCDVKCQPFWRENRAALSRVVKQMVDDYYDGSQAECIDHIRWDSSFVPYQGLTEQVQNNHRPLTAAYLKHEQFKHFKVRAVQLKIQSNFTDDEQERNRLLRESRRLATEVSRGRQLALGDLIWESDGTLWSNMVKRRIMLGDEVETAASDSEYLVPSENAVIIINVPNVEMVDFENLDYSLDLSKAHSATYDFFDQVKSEITKYVKSSDFAAAELPSKLGDLAYWLLQCKEDSDKGHRISDVKYKTEAKAFDDRHGVTEGCQTEHPNLYECHLWHDTANRLEIDHLVAETTNIIHEGLHPRLDKSRIARLSAIRSHKIAQCRSRSATAWSNLSDIEKNMSWDDFLASGKR